MHKLTWETENASKANFDIQHEIKLSDLQGHLSTVIGDIKVKGHLRRIIGEI